MYPATHRCVTRGPGDGAVGLHVVPLFALVIAVTLAIVAVAAHVGWLPAPPGLNLRTFSPPLDGPVVETVCGRCGTIESVQQIDARRIGPMQFGLSGPVAGQLAGGLGHDLTNALGLLMILLAPHQPPPDAAPRLAYATTVRFEDGSGRLFTGFGPPAWQPGDRVKVVNGRIHVLAEAPPVP